MDVANTQKELWSYCSANDFISKDKIADFQKRLTKEGNQDSLQYALEKYEPSLCPKCKADGAYKWHFLGKHTYSACNVSWYVDPGTYIVRSIKDIFRTGAEAGGEMGFTQNKKGESGGFIGFIFGFIFFGLLFEVLLPCSRFRFRQSLVLHRKKIEKEANQYE